MRDLYKSIDYIERGVLRGLDRSKPASSALPKGMVSPKPQIRAWRAPVTAASDDPKPVCLERVFRPKKPKEDTSKDLPSRDPPPRDPPPRDPPKASTSRNPAAMAKLTLSARALKITIPLDAMEVRALPDPGGQAPRCQLAITCEGKVYTADVATKAVRKAKSTISANGAENVFAMIQGKLRGNEIVEAGLVAQVKTPKPSASVEAATASAA
jgi:hypothetical protein